MSYIPLANVTLGASATTVTFSSIPATYQDLVLVASPITPSFPNWLGIRFNSVATSGAYPAVSMRGNGTSALSETSTDFQMQVPGQLQASERGLYKIEVMDYAITNKHKSVLASGNYATGAGTPSTTIIAGRLASTSAITSMTLLLDSAVTFSSGSTFALYGIIA
jgi:hypothetical protein